MLRRPAVMRVWVMVASVALGFAGNCLGAPSDAFFDHPLPDGVPSETRTAPVYIEDPSHRQVVVLGYTTFWSGVQLLGALAGKPVRLPATLAEWPDELTEHGFGREVGAKVGAPTRTFFDALCQNLNLSWSYDATADAIDLRPAWRRDDPRSGKELVAVLLGSRPADPGTLTWEPAPWPSLGRPVRDPWRLAFDALLSRPENFALAGALRLCHDQHGLPEHPVVDNLCAAQLIGTDGRVRVLVLNDQPKMMVRTGIAGEVAYYLFDEGGRFLRGGVYSILPHATTDIVGARVEGEGCVTVALRLRGVEPPWAALRFALTEDDDLVLRGSTSDGVERNAEDTQKLVEPPDGPVVEWHYQFPAR